MAVSVSALAVLGVRRRVPEMHIYMPGFTVPRCGVNAGSSHIEEPGGMTNGKASLLLLPVALPLVLRRGSCTSRAALHEYESNN